MLKHKETYEIIAPEDIGFDRTNEAGIVLGKLRYVIYNSSEPLFNIYMDLLHPVYSMV